MIFRGKQLKDNDSVNFYKISDLDVIHLVAKTNIDTNNENTIETEPPLIERGRGLNSIFNIPVRSRGMFNLNEVPFMPGLGRRRRISREDNTGSNI